MTGCFDRKELNDRAIWLASGWDIDEENKIKLSAQIIIPSAIQPEGGGGSSPSFMTFSASGLNVGEALQTLQAKLSREAFYAQRKAIFIGEDLAKAGIKNELDATLRGANLSLLSDIFIVKDGTAKEALETTDPLEKIPSNIASKEYSQVVGKQYSSLLRFLSAVNDEGITPTIPVIEIGEPEAKGPLFKLAGAAIFDQNLKLVDYLSMDDNRIVLWLLGRLNTYTVATHLNSKSNISLDLNKLNSKITPTIKNDRISFHIQFTGTGSINENNSDLNIFKTEKLEDVKKKLEAHVKKDANKMITQVQKDPSLDIFGFGEAVHRKYPYKWKSLKKDWNKTFAEANVSIDVNFKIKQIGLTGPSLLYEESEKKK